MNEKARKRPYIVQILGWKDRVARMILGAVMVAVPLTVITLNMPLWLDELGGAPSPVSPWHYVILLASLYPFTTAAWGWDPVYALFGLRTCDDRNSRNPCGTLPYQMDSALGRHPVPESDIEHSLDASHHDYGRHREQGRAETHPSGGGR
ncbi:MAG: DUF2892 domain-containing protein [Gammaproteobacteria bacterium]